MRIRLPSSISRALVYAGDNYAALFALGASVGAGFTLFKIYFAFNGVNYYKVYQRNQLKKELDEYEKRLREFEMILRTGQANIIGAPPSGFTPPRTVIERTKVGATAKEMDKNKD